MGDPDDPVPYGLVLNLDEAFRVLGALEDSLVELLSLGAAPGLQDELATAILELSTVGWVWTREACDDR